MASDYGSTAAKGNIGEVYTQYDEHHEEEEKSNSEEEGENSENEFEDEGEESEEQSEDEDNEGDEGSEDEDDEGDEDENESEEDGDEQDRDLEAGHQPRAGEDDESNVTEGSDDDSDSGNSSDNTDDIFESYADEPRDDKKAEKEEDPRRRKKKLLLGAFCLVLLIIIAIVLVVVLSGGKDDDENEITKATAPIAATAIPVAAPTLAPETNSPSFTLETPVPTPALFNGTEAPTGFNETEAPTQDPLKTFFPVSADTCISDGEFADLSFGASQTLEIGTANSTLNSVALLLFDLSALPPDAESILLDSSISLRLFRTGSLASPFSEITISRLLNPQEGLDIDALTWNDFNESLAEEGLIDGPIFTVSSETDFVQVEIKELLQPEIELRRPGRELQDGGFVLLVLHSIDDENSFQSREAGEEVSPVIIHEYVDAIITTCAVDPCGSLATCWELDGGAIICECDNGDRVDYLQACPTNSSNCQQRQGRIYDAGTQECVCPLDKPEEDSKGFCFPLGSPCLEDPCAGIGSTCHDDKAAPAGYICKCSDDSAVLNTENCDFATITSCDPPYPCGSEALCFTRENAQGEETIGCACEDKTEVAFGESCATTGAS